ncbi:MAG: DUF1826 domain-containing protein [Pseudomonadota bacterium]
MLGESTALVGDRRPNPAPSPSTQPLPGVHVVGAAAALGAIHRPGCAAALWDRPRDCAFARWIDDLAPQALPQGRLRLRPDAVARAVGKLCDEASTPPHAMRDVLIDDIARLARQFATVMGASELALRLEAVSSNACAKFHIDAVAARLLCTYRGTGTELAFGPDGAPALTLPTGAALILRGKLWPTTPAVGLLHRSPPIAGTGETRLLLVIDVA